MPRDGEHEGREQIESGLGAEVKVVDQKDRGSFPRKPLEEEGETRVERLLGQGLRALRRGLAAKDRCHRPGQGRGGGEEPPELSEAPPGGNEP